VTAYVLQHVALTQVHYCIYEVLEEGIPDVTSCSLIERCNVLVGSASYISYAEGRKHHHIAVILVTLITFRYELATDPDTPQDASSVLQSTRFIILNSNSVPTVYLCLPYFSHSKQRLFPHTALTGWAL
jgi:hypothetical protein